MKKPFHMSGSFQDINDGIVTSFGDTGLFLVKDRTATGVLGDNEIGSLESDIEGTFSMTYNAIIDIATQEGPLLGKFQFHDEEQDETYGAFFHARSEGELTYFDPEVGGTMEIELKGRLWFSENARGGGRFDALVEVELDENGHIVGIADSNVTIKGRWNPDIENRWDHHFANRWGHHAEERWIHKMVNRCTDDFEDRSIHHSAEQSSPEADLALV